MNVVGNYALVRDVCRALQAGAVVRSEWRSVYPLRRIQGLLCFCALTERGLTCVTGSVHTDAYEAAVKFVESLPKDAPMRVSR